MGTARAPSIIELVRELRAGRLALQAALVALEARGMLGDADYREEVATIRRLRDAGELDAGSAVSLILRLGAMRIGAVSVPAIDPRTIPVEPARPVSPPSEPMTVVRPPAGEVPQSHPARTNRLRAARARAGGHVAAGSVLKDRFHLERVLGRGGMGVVYLARDERKVEARDRNPYVAVKVLNDKFRRHPDALVALQRESRRSQQLAHDNIVRVFDFDKDRSTVFMTMEYIDGRCLKSLIRRYAHCGMPLVQARPLIEGMARALARAHAAGIVHSDFKPGNVMVARSGTPKVLDFGIARASKFVGDNSDEQTLFDAGTLGGLTPAYASLEIIRGCDPWPGDDIYALGCVVFELLTGQHPFGKASAEVALKEWRVPPPVPGLTRRQYRVLCDSVAFDAERRLTGAEALIEGLREVKWKERAWPYVMYGSLALATTVAGCRGSSWYLHGRHLADVVERFSPADRGRYADERQALQAVEGLDEDCRKRAVIEHGDVIQDFLLAQLEAYWSPAHQRYDYAGVQRVLATCEQLRLCSPALDSKGIELEQQRHVLLNALDTELTRRMELDALFEDQHDNVVATLARIRAVDPSSAMLTNVELELKYALAVGRSLKAGHTVEAEQRLRLGLRLFPDSMHLQQRVVELEAYELAEASRQAVKAASAGSFPRDLVEARAELAALIARPAMTAKWQVAVVRAAAPLRGDVQPQTRWLFEALAEAVAKETAKETDPTKARRAVALAQLGLDYAPRSQRLLAERNRLDQLQQQWRAKQAKDCAVAEIASRIESLRRAAAAGDTLKAHESFARVRKLQGDHPFLAAEGTKLVAESYLAAALHAFRQELYQSAADTLNRGEAALGGRDDLRKARERYVFVAELMHGEGALTEADHARLKEQSALLRAADGAAMDRLETDMKLRRKLPKGSLRALLDARKPPSAGPAMPASVTPNRSATPPVALEIRPLAHAGAGSAVSAADLRLALAGKPGAER